MENHGQKRSAHEQEDVLNGVQTILLDIEGTTTPLAFVQEKLFPYVKTNAKTYLNSHYGEDECQADIEALRTQAEADKDASVDGVVTIPQTADDNQEAVVEAAVKNILWQMEKDLKTKALRQLQAHMWREAYKTGLLQGEVFDDVPAALREWVSEGKQIYTYSSDCVDGQKLLLGYSDKGNLLELFSGYFDAKVGAKNEKDTYTHIVGEINAKPEAVVYITGLPKEAKAAADAGLKTVVIIREGNAPLSDEDKQCFLTVTSFTELCSSESPKAKRVEGEHKVAKHDEAGKVDGEKKAVHADEEAAA